jgi:radical SAM protein with 4Fe4S-binding SPASM domain
MNLFAYTTDIFKLAYQRKHDRLIKPRFINFLLTYKCNARCLMCGIWDIYRRDPQKAKQELTLEDIEKILIANKSFLSSVSHIGFTGGDPLLMRDDFVDIVRIFQKHLPEARLGVQTNGLLPDLARTKLKEIITFYPELILAVSVDGIDQTHSKVRGVDNAFDLAVQTINYAKGLGVKLITCGMTLTSYNYNEIIAVKEKVKSLGCEFSCFLAEEADYFNNYSSESDCSLSSEQKSKIAKQLGTFSAYHYFMDNLRLLLEGKRIPKVVCFSGFSSLVIDPYGNVKPCILKVKNVADDIFGNINDQPLEVILNSQKAKSIKQKIKQCNCWCQCESTSSVFVYPLDTLKWFIFYCKDKRGFLKINVKRAVNTKLR